METIRRLENLEILVHQGWHDTAADLLERGQRLEHGQRVHGLGLIEAVMERGLSIAKLSDLRSQARTYDGNAAKMLGDIYGDHVDYEDKIAAFAGRLAHHAGNDALGQVGSARKKEYYRIVEWKRRQNSYQEAMLGIDGFDITRIVINRVK